MELSEEKDVGVSLQAPVRVPPISKPKKKRRKII